MLTSQERNRIDRENKVVTRDIRYRDRQFRAGVHLEKRIRIRVSGSLLAMGHMLAYRSEKGYDRPIAVAVNRDQVIFNTFLNHIVLF